MREIEEDCFALALCVTVHAGKAWSGRLLFDSARYRDFLSFKKDYPRINYLPALRGGFDFSSKVIFAIIVA